MNRHYFPIFLLLSTFSLFPFFSGLHAQPLQYGQAVTTCFSGLVNPTDPSAGALNDFVLGIVDVRDQTSAPFGQNWSPPMFHHPDWVADTLGQIFGAAIDVAGNIYVTATSVYGDFAYGPGGGGGVYRIDATTWAPSLIASLPNTAATGQPEPGLGNICYDPVHDQLFVSNMDDGQIYRLNTSGTVLAPNYDPFNPDNGSAGFAPKGERIWGLGIYDGRLYYSVWEEDRRDLLPNTTSNKIWSVEIGASGALQPGTELLEITLPVWIINNYSNPVADIAFSSSGRMLLGERTMNGDFGDQSNPNFVTFSHQARVLEYEHNGTNWSLVAPGINKYLIGGWSDQNNAAGGVDYAYMSFDTLNGGPLICDSMIWATADAMHPNHGGTGVNSLYGLHGTNATTGGTAATSHLIDLNGVFTVLDKTQVGDVEIFGNCVILDPCDTINTKMSIEVIPIDGSPYAVNLVSQVSPSVSNPFAVIVEWCLDDTIIGQVPNDTLFYDFGQSGYFEVCLKTLIIIEDPDGDFICCHDTICETIYLPEDTCFYHEAAMTCQVDPVNPLSYTFTDNSNFGDQTVWLPDTNDPGSLQTGTGPGSSITHTYPAPGTYQVCMMSLWHPDSILCCIDTIYKTIVVAGGDSCGGGFAAFDWFLNNGTEVTFDNLSVPGPPQLISQNWDFGDGATATTFNAFHDYMVPGTYTACLSIVYTNLAGTDTCFDTICHVLDIIPPGPCAQHQAAFTASQIPGTFDILLTDVSTQGDVSEWIFTHPVPATFTTGGVGSTLMYGNGNPDFYALCLVSTWFWDPNDPTAVCVDTTCDTVWVSFSMPPPPSAGMFLSPNPVENSLNIIFNNPEQESIELTIFDIRGTILYQAQSADTRVEQLNVQDLKPGIYMIECRSKGILERKKFIKL